jgi:hypothetical protein
LPLAPPPPPPVKNPANDVLPEPPPPPPPPPIASTLIESPDVEGNVNEDPDVKIPLLPGITYDFPYPLDILIAPLGTANNVRTLASFKEIVAVLES